MLKESQVKRINTIKKRCESAGDDPLTIAVELAKATSLALAKNHRYFCGLESLEISDEKWSYRDVEQPGKKARGFFLSPDGQNGEFYYALRDVGFKHHFYKAEYHWGVRTDSGIILTYTEGDIDVFQQPETYQHPRS